MRHIGGATMEATPVSSRPLRWGFLSTAQIARKNWQAIRLSGSGVVTAVASRDVARSRQFIAECQAEVPFATPPAALGSYAELLARPDVDAVYVPLPTGLRREWVVRAAEAGKHVLCEKPCAPSLVDLDAMLAACRRHGVQFMDGVMFMHSRRLAALRQVLDDRESVGRLRRLTAQFSFCAPEEFRRDNIRMHSQLEPHGCLGDLGWYCLRLILWTQQWELPTRVAGRMLTALGRGDSPHPVPAEFSGELWFGDGVSAGFYCSFLTHHQEWAHFSGDRGCLQVSDFVLPFFGSEVGFEVNNADFQVSGCQFNMEPRIRRCSVREYSNSHPTAQEAGLFRNFAAAVAQGRPEERWPEYSRKTQQVMAACYESARDDGRPVTLD